MKAKPRSYRNKSPFSPPILGLVRLELTVYLSAKFVAELRYNPSRG